MKKIFCDIIVALLASTSFAQIGQITVDGDRLMDGTTEYQPLVINYILTIKVVTDSTHPNFGQSYISPTPKYTSQWIQGMNHPAEHHDPGENWMSTFVPSDGGPDHGDINFPLEVFENDMESFSDMGFNSVRIMGLEPVVNSGSLEFVSGISSVEYFEHLQTILGILDAHNLRAILQTGDQEDWSVHDDYVSFLEQLGNALGDDGRMLAIDLYNEPYDDSQSQTENDKYFNSERVSQWHNAFKKGSSILTTIGLQEPLNVHSWDAGLMEVDFPSFHFYANDMSPTQSADEINTFLYWSNEVFSDKPWIIGETGFSAIDGFDHGDGYGMVGTEASQALFAANTMQRSLDCDCNGYSWWQAREVRWPNEDPELVWPNHVGIYTRYPENRQKAVGDEFMAYHSIIPLASNCVEPSNYYDTKGYDSDELTGTVEDHFGNSIQNAVVTGVKYDPTTGGYPYYSTFTDADGNFTLSSRDETLNFIALKISYPGYTMLQWTTSEDGPVVDGLTYNIHPNNLWALQNTNWGSDWLGGWRIKESDIYLSIDVDGDHVDEILSLQSTGGSSDLWVLQDMENGEFLEISRNNGSDYLGTWQLGSSSKFIVTDLDGDDHDELLCYEVTNGPNDRWEVLEFQSGAWVRTLSNWGSDWLGSKKMREGDLILSLDADGDGDQEILHMTKTDNDDNDLWKLLGRNSAGWFTIGQNWASGWLGSWRIRKEDVFIPINADGGSDQELLCFSQEREKCKLFSREADGWHAIHDNGDNGYIGTREMESGDEFYPIDIDGDGVQELLIVNKQSKTWDVLFFENGDWTRLTENPDHMILNHWSIEPKNLFTTFETDSGKEQLLATENHNSSENDYSIFRGISSNFRSGGTGSEKLWSSNTGNQEEHSLMISVSPNPAAEEFELKVNSSGGQIRMFNLLGKECLSQTVGSHEIINVTGLKSGVYLLKLETSEGEQILKKIVIR